MLAFMSPKELNLIGIYRGKNKESYVRPYEVQLNKNREKRMLQKKKFVRKV